MTPPARTTGIVYLVGAGPGAPELITLRGVECLQKAQVVVYDYLANEQLLNHAPRDAERI
jgi:uroporphyrinogen III methyltransferase / synthase